MVPVPVGSRGSEPRAGKVRARSRPVEVPGSTLRLDPAFHIFLDVLMDPARRAIQANQGGWMRWMPGLRTLRSYESSWLRRDIVAGLVMTTMLVPVGIAYA